jgi:hypothetical protein
MMGNISKNLSVIADPFQPRAPKTVSAMQACIDKVADIVSNRCLCCSIDFDGNPDCSYCDFKKIQKQIQPHMTDPPPVPILVIENEDD